MNKSKGTIHLVDDDYAVRDALGILLRTEGYLVESYESAEYFYEHYNDVGKSCLILDLRLPGENGLEVQQFLKNNSNSTPIIFISAHGTIPDSVSAMKSGAHYFLEKPFDNSLLLSLIETALEKHEKNHLSSLQNAVTLTHYKTLTSREKEVMAGIVEGKTNREMAETMKISSRTVERHRLHVMKKMKTGSIAKLVENTMLYNQHHDDKPLYQHA